MVKRRRASPDPVRLVHGAETLHRQVPIERGDGGADGRPQLSCVFAGTNQDRHGAARILRGRPVNLHLRILVEAELTDVCGHSYDLHGTALLIRSAYFDLLPYGRFIGPPEACDFLIDDGHLQTVGAVGVVEFAPLANRDAQSCESSRARRD